MCDAVMHASRTSAKVILYVTEYRIIHDAENTKKPTPKWWPRPIRKADVRSVKSAHGKSGQRNILHILFSRIQVHKF